jgi:phage N-6-adenine-methyltransferase
LGEDGSVHRVLVPGEPYPEELDSIPYVQFEERALVFREDTPFEVWSEVVGRLKSAEKSIQWWIGDALRFGERKYGEMYSQALEATDYSYGALRDAAWVSGRVELSRRRDNLPWSHHREVAALEPEEQDALLDAAAPGEGEEKPRMSVREVREKAQELKTLPPGVAPILTLDNHRALGTGENEWYTPPDVLEDVRAVLGEIDLDPASSERAQGQVSAARYFSIEDNALLREWGGRVYLNPPYSQPAIDRFTAKLVEEYRAGRVTEAVMLTHNYTDTRWFHTAEAEAAAICFTRGRIRFISPSGELAAPTQGQAFFYYGPRVERFIGVFQRRGFVR